MSTKEKKEKMPSATPKGPRATPKGQRIAKIMARAGVASRRESERMIKAGQVKVNGKALDTPAFLVTDKDKIEVNGKIIMGKEIPRLWRYHKPSGFLTTHNDPGGRPTVFENLPADLPRVISIGRLDMTSEGLLLLTNDGELARKLELPSTAWARRYKTRAYGKPTQEKLDSLMQGVMIDGRRTGPIEAKLDKQQGTNAWMSITIREGKNREVRRALEVIGLKVNRLIRISYGPFQLGDLDKGKVELVPNRILRDQVGHLVDISTERPRGTLQAREKINRKISKKIKAKPMRGNRKFTNKNYKGKK
ncbi:MAG: pseudouridine synthase [Robiginitomaculum sp.]